MKFARDIGMLSNMDKKRTYIRAVKNGPLKISNIPAASNIKAEKKGDTFICRCGASKNKPYCDGTHIKIGFKSAKSPDRKAQDEKAYTGKEITIHFDYNICSRAAFCVKEAPEVFKANRRPWIMPDLSDIKKIVNVIRKCPSGALSYTLNGKRVDSFDSSCELVALNKGPLDVKGSIELLDDDGDKPKEEDHYTLCRCGRSLNKPFCDGTHIK